MELIRKFKMWRYKSTLDSLLETVKMTESITSVIYFASKCKELRDDYPELVKNYEDKYKDWIYSKENKNG